MKTKYEHGTRVIIEEFDMFQMKEYLEHAIKFSDDKAMLLRIASAINPRSKAKWHRELNLFKLYTEDRGLEEYNAINNNSRSDSGVDNKGE